MKKETLLTIAVLILIVLNVALLTVFYVNQGRPPFTPPFPGPNTPAGNGPVPGKVIVERLKFDDSQQKEFMKLVQQHREKVQAIQEESRILHNELFDLLKEPQRDTSRVRALINSLGDNRKELEQLIFEHFAAIKALCKTDEQRKLFNIFIGELGETIGPPAEQNQRGGSPWQKGPPPEK
jgi:Spy/CpxP family protein refolding chaperone